MNLFIKETLKTLNDENNLKFDEKASTKSRIDKYLYIVNIGIELLNIIILTRNYKILTKKLQDNIYEIVDGWIYVLNIEDLRDEKQVGNLLYLSEALSELLKITIVAKHVCYLYNTKIEAHNKLIIDYYKFIDENIIPLIIKNKLEYLLANIEKINTIISGNTNQLDYIKNTIINYRNYNRQNSNDINNIREELNYINRIFTNIYNMLKYEMRYI
jgi:hypothetical protein